MRYLTTSALLVALLAGLARAQSDAKPRRQAHTETLVVADNPKPGSRPALGVWRRGLEGLVSADVANAPDFTCDAWCYESAMDLLDARRLDGGRVWLRHRSRDFPSLVIVTTVTPEDGAVEFMAHAELDREKEAGGQLPAKLPVPNICCQLKRAKAFASAPEAYPEF